MKGKQLDMFNMDLFGRQFAIRTIHLTSTTSTFIFAMVYGMIEHTLLASSLGLGILVHPLSVHIFGQVYFYHVLMFILAILISFNPFFDILLFSSNGILRKQALLWGTGNIVNFLWLEDLFYWILFGEWPKDAMTPLHLSFYGIVWWYPVSFLSASIMYYLTIHSIRRMKKGEPMT